jgi:hypothetical protein
MMVPENQERHKTAYTVTVDAAEGEFFYLLVAVLDQLCSVIVDADSSTLCCCLYRYTNLHLPYLTGRTIQARQQVSPPTTEP